MVGKMIKKHRLKQGLSLAKLAEQTGLEKSVLSSIEKKGHLPPSIELLEMITPALGLSVDTLLAECEQDETESVWDHIVIDALEAGMPPEEYIEFIAFIKKLSQSTTLKMPSTYYFERFGEKTVAHG